MKNIYFLLTTFLLLLAGCSSGEKYIYLHDAPRDEAMEITNNYTSSIFEDDVLYIYVSSNNPQSVVPFNEETNKATFNDGRRAIQPTTTLNGYKVDHEGNIQFPILGKLHVIGMTRDALARLIEARLIEQKYVKDPVVTVDIKNFHVSVIGEVANPAMLIADGNRLTILEAIARCGDVTIHGRRDMVTIVRFNTDSVVVDTIDLTSQNMLNSPYYYLQQNDIVYVEPNRKKKRQAYSDNTWTYYVKAGVDALRLAYIIYYRYAILGPNSK